MGKGTAIEWTDHTFNPWWGCAKVSAGCANCYAEGVAGRWAGGARLWGPNAQRRPVSNARWRDPERWNDAARRHVEAGGRPARVFCASMADVFEDRGELWQMRARLFALILETPYLEWQILTKRPDVARKMLGGAALAIDVDDERVALRGEPGPDFAWPPANVILGTSVEDQETAAARVPELLAAPAARRFLSVEPLIGPVDLAPLLAPRWDAATGAPRPAVDWIIVGGESGPKARPMRLEWARQVVKDGRAAGAAVFVKQLGRRPVELEGGREVLLDVGGKGGDPDAWPADLRVREFPTPHHPTEVLR